MNSLLNYTLVLLPGLDGTGLLFSYFLEHFPKMSNIIVVQYPTDQVLDYEQLAEIARNQLPESADFILVGESFSGPIAARLINHPRLSGIIFCASFLTSPRPILLNVLRYMPLTVLIRFPMPSFLLRFACFGYSCPDKTLNSFRKTIRSVQPDVFAYRLRLLCSVNDLWRIKESPVPLGYLKASDDKLVPASKMAEINVEYPHLRVHKVAGSHFLLQGSPAMAKDAIIALCDRLTVTT